MKKLNKLVLREHFSPADLINKKAQKNILGGYKIWTVCCRPSDGTPGCTSTFSSSECSGNLCNGGNYNCY